MKLFLVQRWRFFLDKICLRLLFPGYFPWKVPRTIPTYPTNRFKRTFQGFCQKMLRVSRTPTPPWSSGTKHGNLPPARMVSVFAQYLPRSGVLGPPQADGRVHLRYPSCGIPMHHISPNPSRTFESMIVANFPFGWIPFLVPERSVWLEIWGESLPIAPYEGIRSLPSNGARKISSHFTTTWQTITETKSKYWPWNGVRTTQPFRVYFTQTKHLGGLTWRNQRCPRETWLQWTFCGFYFNWKKRGQVRSIPWWNEELTMKWQGSFMKNYHIFASSLMFEWTLCFYSHFGKLLRILPFFGVRFEHFPENAQFNATPKVIISSTQTMHYEKRKSLKLTSNIFLQLWSPKTGETIFMIPGFHSWLILKHPPSPPQKKNTKNTSFRSV